MMLKINKYLGATCPSNRVERLRDQKYSWGSDWATITQHEEEHQQLWQDKNNNKESFCCFSKFQKDKHGTRNNQKWKLSKTKTKLWGNKSGRGGWVRGITFSCHLQVALNPKVKLIEKQETLSWGKFYDSDQTPSLCTIANCNPMCRPRWVGSLRGTPTFEMYAQHPLLVTSDPVLGHKCYCRWRPSWHQGRFLGCCRSNYFQKCLS